MTDRVLTLTNALDRLKTFDARQQYMDTHAMCVGTGSGRRVYAIGEGKVLKLARNAKGQAQNNVESNYDLHRRYDQVFTTVYQMDPDNMWLRADEALEAYPDDFQRVFGVKPHVVWRYLEKRLATLPTLKPEALDESEMLQELISACKDFTLVHHELQQLGAWGVVGEKLVVRDYGLTQSVWTEFYETKSPCILTGGNEDDNYQRCL